MMKPERLREALVECGRLAEGHPGLEHVVGMVPRALVLVDEGRREKVMRWLGFMQGALWHARIATLDELKLMNAPKGTILELTEAAETSPPGERMPDANYHDED